ncbi:MAG: glycosyltransferase [Gemmataceae bacterium]
MPSVLSVAIGPVMPGWGSWDWVGTFLVEQLQGPFRTTTFQAGEIPRADLVAIVKHAPPPEWVEAVSKKSAIIYCPIDWYGDPREIEADSVWLRKCARIVVHCHRLKPYFASLAETSYLDHPLKFAIPTRRSFRPEGSLLWVGVRSNLPPLVAWVNQNPLSTPLDILTNPENPGQVPSAADLGFTNPDTIRVHEWNAERHRAFTNSARAALDIKGEDFRARHKPPAKALDYIASGVPLALNAGSSPAEHLAGLGLKVPSPSDPDRWLSERYWEEVQRLGERLIRELAPQRITNRFQKLLESVIASRPQVPTSAVPSTPLAATTEKTLFAKNSEDPERRYEQARELALAGEHVQAESILLTLIDEETPPQLRALLQNDLATLAVLAGDQAQARERLQQALKLNPECEPARVNLALLTETPEPTSPRPTPSLPASSHSVRVAVVSLLFNWPSTGGGNVHSAELTLFLSQAGYEVRHFYAKYEPWGIGNVTEPTPYPTQAVSFSSSEWTGAGITRGFRRVLDEFDPNWVILTDSWNLKPVLAAACGGRPYILRLQALECLCPLNNVRLLPAPGGKPKQCNRHQLATPDECSRCVRELDHTSGDLHRAERALAGVGTPQYRDTLFEAFRGATSVLVVNPLTAAMVEPHSRDVRVVTAGMDPARFPWPFPPEKQQPRTPGQLRILFAGLTHEWMKGFHILREACSRLWATRQDFEVVATDQSPDDAREPWAKYVGWQSQGELPGWMASADIVVVPTVAQEALGRTAVEAMAAGKPVVASRLGGLPFTVAEGATGLLCESGDPADLAATLSMLLDDAELRTRLGATGRRRFEEHYSWPAIIERHYLQLLGNPTATPRNTSSVLVVVSYYAGRPIQPLIQLLDSMTKFPAGANYSVRVVVNRDGEESISLPERHRGVEVQYRPNTGYNIGAWEAGWRAAPAHDAYLFVQDECRVIRADWVGAFLRAQQSSVGLVGECESPDWDAPWTVLATRFRGQVFKEHAINGMPAERVDCYLDFFRRQGIPHGPRGDHLQSLVLFATRVNLERVGGFPEGGNYGEAIAAEIGMSKKIQAAGLTLARVGAEPFHFIEHPQWLHRRTEFRRSQTKVRV